MATEYERIKKAVEVEKNKKVQGEARINSLQDEEQRILSDVTKEVGKPISSREEVEQLANDMKSEIESNIFKMKQILEAEGVQY